MSLNWIIIYDIKDLYELYYIIKIFEMYKIYNLFVLAWETSNKNKLLPSILQANPGRSRLKYSDFRNIIKILNKIKF